MDDDSMEYPRKYCPGPDWCEDNELYDIGGLHPVVIGDSFRDGQYSVVHKLGYGGFSTVWLARDHRAERYVALKILSAAGSRCVNEIAIQRYIRALGMSFDDLSITKIIDRFSFRGPNGRHTCLVLEVAGPSLNFLDKHSLKLRPDSVRDLAAQVAGVVRKLHTNDIAIGDLSTDNILLKVKNLSSWSEEEIYQRFGEPEASEACPTREGESLSSHAPRYQYDHIHFGWCDLDVLEPNVTVADMNEAVYTGSNPALHSQAESSAANRVYAAPEWWFGVNQKHTKASDIFALACIFFELRTASPLLPAYAMTDGAEVIQLLLGEAPQEWKDLQNDRDEDQQVELLSHEECGSESLDIKLAAVGKWEPWHYMTSEQRKQHFFDTYDEEERNDPDKDINIERDSSTRPPPARLSDEEHHDLKDLLSRMLTYLPEERITIEEVLQHPWLNKRYDDLDDQTAPWICRYDRGFRYYNATEWYRAYVLNVDPDSGDKAENGGIWRLDEENPKFENGTFNWDVFYDSAEDIWYDAVESQEFESDAPEPEEADEEEEDPQESEEVMTDSDEEEFSVTKLLGLPVDSDDE